MTDERYISKDSVIKVIDEVMNNREIDSIRNAILAIRDKVIKEKEVSLAHGLVRVRVRNKCVILPEFGVDGSARDGSAYAELDMFAKQDTGEYGEVCYKNADGSAHYSDSMPVY